MHLPASFRGCQEARINDRIVHALYEMGSTGGADTLSASGRQRTTDMRNKMKSVLIIYLLIYILWGISIVRNVDLNNLNHVLSFLRVSFSFSA